MKKKSLTLLLVFTLLLSLALPALAAQEPELIVTVPEENPLAGESFDVTLEVLGNPGFHTIEFTLTYDRSKLSCDAVEEGEMLEDALTVTNPNKSTGAFLTAASLKAVGGDGLLATFRFTAKEDLYGRVFGVVKPVLGDEEGDPIAITVTGPDAFAAKPGGGDEPDEPTPGPDDPSGGGSEPESPVFTDIAGHWAEEDIARAAALGLFEGHDDGSFKPDDYVTRAQFLTVLYRLAGREPVTVESPFTDLAGQIDEFKTAIAWGYEKGYVDGKSATRFDPNGTITRQEAMKILFGYAGGVRGTESLFTSAYDGFYTDSGKIAAWAKPAMYWGVYNKIISGAADHLLDPEGKATRAQLARILVNYLDEIH